MRAKLSVFLAVIAALSTLTAEPPRGIPPGVTIELVASEPDIRTPTAVAVDRRGAIWVLENNTHFRPKIYDAPPSDRIVILDDFAPDGRARKITTFADGFRDGMGLLLLPGGDAIVSTRAETFRLRDTNGDGRADERRTLLRLETADKYPHNGLSGIALGPDGKLYLGLGENHGYPWTLTGSDGAVLCGTDEGAVFQVDPEGRGLVWWALGIWNPFGLAFDPAGRLFALDNDPGGGSLCRLLHIVRGGDYGYRYRYGRTTDHPFISWDGRWPGTLPMVCYAGEAPTGLLWHDGALLGCTWTDHAVQRFALTPRGASFTAKPELLVRGGHDFRPSGIAPAQNGELVVSDWVDGSYDVHGKGRVWRIRGLKTGPSNALPRSATEATLAQMLEGKLPAADALAMFRSGDPFLVHGAIRALAESSSDRLLADRAADPDPEIRLGVLLTMRRGHHPLGRGLLSSWLKDPDTRVRRAALQWTGEDKVKELELQLGESLEGNPTLQSFEAYLAASEQLAATKIDYNGGASAALRFQRMAEIALDAKRQPALRSVALRLLPIAHPALTLDVLRTLLDAGHAQLRLEAARILAARSDEPAQVELRRAARNQNAAADIRAEALAGLAFSAASSSETREILKTALGSNDALLSREAARSLGETLAPTSPADGVAANSAAGRRLFFHPNGPQCATCHQIEGRGRAIGPDLTGAWRTTPEQLIEAIREPSKEIAPAYIQWHIKLRDGREAVGIDQFVDSKSDFTLLDATGQRTKLRFDDVVSREAMPIFFMPPGLIGRLSAQDFADVITYLRDPRE